MNDSADPSLEFLDPHRDGDFEIWEAVDESHPDVSEHVYSCIALYRNGTIEKWPALGGTRWVESKAGTEKGKGEALHQAKELAQSL
jgi:hypothetical protein